MDINLNVTFNPDVHTKAAIARIEAHLVRVVSLLMNLTTNQEKLMAVQDDIVQGVSDVEAVVASLSGNVQALATEAGTLHQLLLDALNANNMNGLADAARRLGVLKSGLQTLSDAAAQAVTADAPPTTDTTGGGTPPAGDGTQAPAPVDPTPVA